MPTAPIPPIGADPNLAGAINPAEAAPAPGFGDALANGLTQISDLEHGADALIQDVATGGPTKVHEAMVAQTESALAIDLLVQVRDRGLEAYQEIMRLQL